MIQAARNDTARTLEADVAVLGAGFAGAATAYHLARLGKRVVVLERESTAGLHSSGRNASMIRQVTSDEAIASLARESARAIRRLAETLAHDDRAELFRGTGSLLLASGERVEPLRRDAEAARAAGVPVALLGQGEVVARFPLLRGSPFEVACHCADDGVVDVAALLRAYLEGACRDGARVLYEVADCRIVVERGAVRGVVAGDVRIDAPVVVDAAGGWAGEVSRESSAGELPLRPTRRHLFTTGAFPAAAPDGPFVWDLSSEVYFRPEAGGLLFSACDVGAPGRSLESDAVDSAVVELLAQKVSRQFPALRDVTIRSGWSGIRTLTPDGRFVIGPDPALEGFFWVAGLGGHGVTTSHAVGELAARLILAPELDAENPHSPSRFACRDESPLMATRAAALRRSAD